MLQLGVTMDYSIFLYHRYEEERERFEREFRQKQSRRAAGRAQ